MSDVAYVREIVQLPASDVEAADIIQIAEDAAKSRSYSRPVFMWEEPPGFVRESVYKDGLLRLKMNPGKWARIINADYSVVAQCAQNMRNSAVVQREGPFEIVSRKLGPGIGAVYARYTGEPEDLLLARPEAAS